MDTIFVRDYPNHAGKWIYNGYASAFEELGYNVKRYGEDKFRLSEVKDSIIMMTDSDIPNAEWLVEDEKYLDLLRDIGHIFMFVSPNKFPEPWNSHLNYVSNVSKNKKAVEALNSLDNITFWTFCEPNEEYYSNWSEVVFVPLAYDAIAYSGKSRIRSPIQYDVVYVGSWANNGFNTKREIMKRYFAAFRDSGLNCGFFINKDITHQQEIDLMVNSSVCLNIHDDYQKELGLDTNERTFKTLGLNGNLVTDFGKHNEHIESLGFEHAYPETDDPQDLVELVRKRKEYDGWNKSRIRHYMRDNETYVDRARKLIASMNDE